MTGPESAEPYFRQIDQFIAATLGDEARKRYRIVINDPLEVARQLNEGLADVQAFRREHGDAYYFNWRLKIDERFQRPFEATHESMASLTLDDRLAPHELAANLRRVFSGIVSGNVREDTAALIQREGPFEIDGTQKIMSLLDNLLAEFVSQNRMKISRGEYDP